MTWKLPTNTSTLLDTPFALLSLQVPKNMLLMYGVVDSRWEIYVIERYIVPQDVISIEFMLLPNAILLIILLLLYLLSNVVYQL